MTDQITEPGWHDGIESDRYHAADICDGPSISASGLKKIALDCPALYWVESPLNPNRYVKPNRNFDFGKAAHCLMLGEPTFDTEFVLDPYGKSQAKEAKEWRAAQSRVIVDADELATIKGMIARLRATPQTANAFRNGVPERSFFARDEETGIWLKARPDWFPTDPATAFIQEYKTAASIRPDKLGRAVFDFGYEIQAALMLDVVAAVIGQAPLGIAHIAQEKVPPFMATLKFFDAAQIERGRRKYKAALKTFATCLERHNAGVPEAIAWPDYVTEPEPFETPFHVRKEMEDDANRSFNA